MRKDIEDALDLAYKNGQKKEPYNDSIELLEESLIEGEIVKLAFRANAANKKVLSLTKKDGLVALTDKRLLYVFKAFWHKESEQIFYSQIVGMSEKPEGFSHGLFIDNSKETFVVLAVRDIANLCISMINEALSPSSSKTNPLDELEKLAELKDKGIITQEEFEAKKKQLLNL
jgi:hypothetical protein